MTMTRIFFRTGLSCMVPFEYTSDELLRAAKHAHSSPFGGYSASDLTDASVKLSNSEAFKEAGALLKRVGELLPNGEFRTELRGLLQKFRQNDGVAAFRS